MTANNDESESGEIRLTSHFCWQGAAVPWYFPSWEHGLERHWYCLVRQLGIGPVRRSLGS
jgi:hypothetical protein